MRPNFRVARDFLRALCGGQVRPNFRVARDFLRHCVVARKAELSCCT